MRWYYARDGVQEGPVDEDGLRELARNGKLDPGDLVWNEDLGEDWVEASTVPDITFGGPPAEAAGAAPPPPPAPAVSVLAEPDLPRDLSCVAPVGPAWRGMVDRLFHPFNLGKWFTLGFSAWLAGLGESGGGGGGNTGGGNLGSYRQGGPRDFDFSEMAESVRAFFSEYGETIAWVTTLVVAVIVVLSLLMVWVRSRGKFMFLDNVVNDRTEIAVPWKMFAQHGNSLFVWNVFYGLACLTVVLALGATTFMAVVLPCLRAGSFVSGVIPTLAVVGFLWVVFAIVAGFIGRCLEDFVVPIMYRFDLTATEAWGRFLKLLKPNFWRVVLYSLFYMALSLGAGLAVMAVVVITCCIAGCLMAIPYVGAVVMLPVSVFFRLYSIGYLAEFGQEYLLAPEG